MELENIVANTQLMKAIEGKGRSKRWKELLKFPHINQCQELEARLHKSGELSFSVIMASPIGQKLVEFYCKEHPELWSLWTFRRELELYKLAPAVDMCSVASKIMGEFVASEMVTAIPKQYLEDIKNKLLTGYPDPLLFTEVLVWSFAELEKMCYRGFLSSIFYCRYLQWRFLSMRPIHRDAFRFYRVLGKGGFGEVHACQKRDTGKMYAVKCLDKKRIKKKKGQALAWNERDILAKVDSPFIVGLKYAFQTKDHLCMVLDLMNGGDLLFHLSNASCFDEPRARFYAAEIVLALEHLHSLNIVYRDLKPENLLLDDKGHIRISDLGLAMEITKEGKSIKGRVGTPGYMAPEVIKGESYTKDVDWWGLGCVIFDMLAGHGPFRARNEHIKLDVLQRRVLEAEIQYASTFQPLAVDIISKLLTRDPKQRLGYGKRDADDIKKHSFFASLDWNRIQAGLVAPPFLPNIRQVNAKDIMDIEPFASIRDVKLTEDDNILFSRFPIVMTKCWEEEILESVFDEMNPFDANNLPDDLRKDISLEEYERRTTKGFFARLRLHFSKPSSASLLSDAKESSGVSSS